MARMTAERAEAKAFMYLEASEHLLQDVTDVSLEKAEAKVISAQLERMADRWFERANQLKDRDHATRWAKGRAADR